MGKPWKINYKGLSVHIYVTLWGAVEDFDGCHGYQPHKLGYGAPITLDIYIYTDRLRDRIFFTTRHASEKITIGLPLGKNTTR